MSEINELNVEALNDVTGGAGGYGGSTKPLPPKAGCKVYRIVAHDTLGKIAKKNGTTVEKIMSLNKGIISDANKIAAGCYIYLPA